jgi:hypothetical protein
MADKWRQKKEPKHVRVYAFLMSTVAWQHLSGSAVKVLLALMSRDDGSRNGILSFSCREAGEASGLSDRTAWRCLQELQEKGFIECTEKGAFSRKVQHASLWRMTWQPWPGGKPAAPTHAYRKWTPDGKTRLKFSSGAVEVSVRPLETDPAAVEETATGKLEKPAVSNDPDYAETTTPIVYQGEGNSAAASQQRKHALERRWADLTDLRERLRSHLQRSQPGEQTRLAARAQIPPGTLSKFIHGRPLPEHHQSRLSEVIA